MCYSDPAKSLSIARARMTQEQWERFEADFEHFCAYSGLVRGYPDAFHDLIAHQFEWAKWAYFKGRQEREQCQCDACRGGVIHDSCCAVHNEPAYPNGPCDCRVADAYFDKIGLAMMSDEQAEASLTRLTNCEWGRRK